MAETGTNAGNTAVGEHGGGITDQQLNVFVLVHAVQVYRLFQVGVDEAAIHTAQGAIAALAGLVEKDALHGDLLVVVLADIEVVFVNDQVGCAGTGTLRVDAEGVAGAVLLLVADQRGPGKGAVGFFVAAHDGEGLHRVVIGGILLGAGANGNIQVAVVLDHIPHGTAVDAVAVGVGRVVKQVALAGNHGKALRGVRRSQDGSAALAGGGIGENIADHELAVIHAHAADTGRNALFVSGAIVLHGGQAHVNSLVAVVLGVDLIHAGQAASAVYMDTAAEVQLAVIGDRVAEQRCIAVEGVGHQQLGLAGLGVYLDQDAAAVHAVLVAIIEGAVEHSFQGCLHNVLIELVAQDILHQGQRVAHSRVAGTHIHPVTVSNSGPAVVLAAVARVVVRVAGVGDHVHCTVPDIVHDAVCRHGALGGV